MSGLLGILLQLPVVLVGLGGLAALLILPRASFKVVIPPGSSRALFIIAVRASVFEKLGGRIDLWREVCEKNNGDGGDPALFLGIAVAA